MPSFLTSLSYKQIGMRNFIVTSPLQYACDLTQSVLTVPIGFPSDGESSPQYLPVINSLFGGIIEEPAFLHDWLYYSALVSRYEADKILLEAMGTLSDIPNWRKYGIYYGLRASGWIAWNAHRRLNHTAKDFPQ